MATTQAATHAAPRANWSRPPVRRVLAVGAVFLLIAGYFLCLARKGLLEDFNPDDTLNMYTGWIQPSSHLVYTAALALWAGEMRPVGKLFYRSLYAWFGFDPLPFRVACFLLLLANLGLLYRLAWRVLGRAEFAALALLAGCFHGALWSIYASTGTVFDVLCLFFLLAMLLCHARWLERPRAWRLVLVQALAIWAMQSKEMGYAAPVLLLVWGVCYGHAWRRRCCWRGSAWAG